MQNYIDSSDVKKRKLILNESGEDNRYAYKDSYRLFNQYKRTNNINDCKEFFNSCSNAKNANTFVSECAKIASVANNRELDRLFKENILPEVTSNTVLDSILEMTAVSDKIKESVNQQIISNKVCDRIISNHDAINKRYDLNQLSEATSDPELIAEKVSNIIDTFNMPPYAKYNCSLEETFYLLQIHGISYNENAIRDTIKFHVYCANPISLGESIKIDNIDKTNHCLKEDVTTDVMSSDIQTACHKFIYETHHTIKDLTVLKDTVINSSLEDLKNHFGDFIRTLTKVALNEGKELVEYIYSKLVPELYDDLYSKWTDNINSREIFNAIDISLNIAVDKCDELLNIYPGNANIIYYQRALKDFEIEISQALEFLYPKYNLECMTTTNIAEESKVISLDEFKVFKFDNLITRCWKLDRFLQKKFKQFKDNTKAKFMRAKSKIFETATVYNTLNEDGSIDCPISKFEISEDQDHIGLMNYCEGCINYINNNLLYGSEYKCYYEIGVDSVTFHIRDTVNAVKLNENDIQLIRKSVPYEDYENLYQIYNIANHPFIENYNISESAKNFFARNSDSNTFQLFVEACSLCGVSKNIINDIYNNLKYTVSDAKSFIIENSYIVNSYEPQQADPYVALEAYTCIQAITNLDQDDDQFDKYFGESTILNEADSNDDDEDDDISEDDEKAYAEYKASLASAKKKNTSSAKKSTPQKKEDPKKQSVYHDNQPEQKQHKEQPKVIQRFKQFNQKAEKEAEQNNPANKKTGNKTIDNIRQKGAEADQNIRKGIKGIKLNNIKLYLNGIKQGIKNLSSKQKTAAMNMNNSGDRFMRSIEKAMVSDRREAIIKGSVIPSFHKCIVIGIGFTALGMFNLPLAIVTAFGSFAISKKLTKKERALMYDDIMIELKLVDKEIQLADQDNDIEKMRSLMKLQKQLQRTAARIQYGNRVGKDIIPGGSYSGEE